MPKEIRVKLIELENSNKENKKDLKMRVERKGLVEGSLTPEFEYVELPLSASEYEDYLSQNKGSDLIISNIE